MTDNRDTLKAIHYTAIGVMSGSSLDGVDLAWCEFSLDQGIWRFRIKEARTVPYSKDMQGRLLAVMDGSALELARLHRDVGKFIGTAAGEMLNGRSIDVIASHGHTVFHKPDEGLTTQIGCGATIAVWSRTPTVCDFRTKDVALGGQGAPLVPLGEKLLFPQHDSFLNLGGIANLSLHRGAVIGYDIGPCNQALNTLAIEAGLEFDRDGEMARSGSVDASLLNRLDALPFHNQARPRSLGREWFNERMLPLITDRRIGLADRLRTVTTHIASIAASELNGQDPTTTLATGGGAHNGFLIELIRSMTRVGIVIPDRVIIDFKEALIFALLGVLRSRGEATALASVTGASGHSIVGSVYLPN